MWVLLSLSLILLSLAIVELYNHHGRLRAIPIRIQVNGIRGKSTTTRLIAAGLRQGGLKVVAKATGSAARLIYEDGSEEPIKRRRVSIAEQLKVVKIARRRGAEALVVECMAVSPENQWVSEHHMIRSTIGVITNVRPDHLDEMGPTMEDLALALSGTIPAKGKLVTAEERYLPIFAQRATRLGTTLYPVRASELSAQEWEALPPMGFADNLACALKVCELVGVERSIALSGMLTMLQDPGVLQLYHKDASLFVNALAANDAQSTLLIWERCQQLGITQNRPIIGVLNNRFDRAQRMTELTATVCTQIPFELIFLVGQLGPAAKRKLLKAGLNGDKIVDLTALPWQEAIESITAASVESLIFAFGNIKGPGWQLIEYFAAKGDEGI